MAADVRGGNAAGTGELFRLMVESVREYAIFTMDAEGRVTTWNVGAERVNGWRAADVLGRFHGIFHTPESCAAGEPERELDIARREGRFEGDGWRVRDDGSRFPAEVALQPDGPHLRRTVLAATSAGESSS